MPASSTASSTASPARRAHSLGRLVFVFGVLLLPLVVAGPSEYRCAPVPVEPAECPAYVGATAAWPFRLIESQGCVAARQQERCATDADCLTSAPDPTTGEPYGPHCVTGNCVACWQDAQCGEGEYCREGRCIDGVAAPPGCPDVGACDTQRCRIVSVSGEPCPVCVCDSIFNRSCAEDFQCQVLSSHPYRHCVWGRCAECRSDDECSPGTWCMQPGLCFLAEPDPSALYGLWLIGWPGGLDHFSYVRFEPDGTLRRGTYVEEGAWSDDIFILSCDSSEWPPSAPQLGTWEIEMTQSMQLAIRIRPNGDCWMGGDHPYRHRYMVTLANDGSLTLRDIDFDGELMGVRIPPARCAADLSTCETPVWEDVYPTP